MVNDDSITATTLVITLIVVVSASCIAIVELSLNSKIQLVNFAIVVSNIRCLATVLAIIVTAFKCCGVLMLLLLTFSNYIYICCKHIFLPQRTLSICATIVINNLQQS